MTDSSNLSLELVASHKIHANRPGWKHIDMREVVKKWFSKLSHLTHKLTLLVDCVGCDSLIDIIFFSDENKNSNDNQDNRAHDADNSNAQTSQLGPAKRHDARPNLRHNSDAYSKNGYRPFMVIATEAKMSRRSRRHTLTCDTKTDQCCKQSLYISFKDLEWDDWIIAPKGYYANYCMGDCSRHRTPDTFVHFHSHVIEEYRSKNPYASITPCCAPTKLSSISLIYFDPDLNIIKADLPKMVVEECGCT